MRRREKDAAATAAATAAALAKEATDKAAGLALEMATLAGKVATLEVNSADVGIRLRRMEIGVIVVLVGSLSFFLARKLS